MREKGPGGQGEREGYLPRRDKRLPLDREETGLAHRRKAVYKGKMGNPVLG